MASAVDNATPPPPHDELMAPSAPRFGTFLDAWEPHARKSVRISSQRAAARTPSPNPAHGRTSASSLRKSNRRSNNTMTSPDASPRKMRRPAPDFIRRASGELTTDSTAQQAGPQDKARKPAEASSSRTSMLPTPAKTPQKPPTQASAAKIKSFARNLFNSTADDTDLPSPSNRGKQYKGMTLESFTAEAIEEPIEIFTDSQDRVPQRDDSAANPFFGDYTAPASASRPRRSKRAHTVTIPGEGMVSVEEASKRSDGMVCVFRGKPIWRFTESHSDNEADQRRSSPAVGSPTKKSRVLFPKQKRQVEEEDEEATTDMEDSHMEDVATSPPHTPTKTMKHSVKTPQGPRFAPVSPPSTKRVTRAAHRLDEPETPMKRSASLKRSGESVPESQAKRLRP